MGSECMGWLVCESDGVIVGMNGGGCWLIGWLVGWLIGKLVDCLLIG